MGDPINPTQARQLQYYKLGSGIGASPTPSFSPEATIWDVGRNSGARNTISPLSLAFHARKDCERGGGKVTFNPDLEARAAGDPFAGVNSCSDGSSWTTTNVGGDDHPRKRFTYKAGNGDSLSATEGLDGLDGHDTLAEVVIRKKDNNIAYVNPDPIIDGKELKPNPFSAINNK